MTDREKYLDNVDRELDELQEEFDRLMDRHTHGPQFEDLFGLPPYKLNLGCGMDHLEDFISIDVEQKTDPDMMLMPPLIPDR
jgi:hypothetical protein